MEIFKFFTFLTQTLSEVERPFDFTEYGAINRPHDTLYSVDFEYRCSHIKLSTSPPLSTSGLSSPKLFWKDWHWIVLYSTGNEFHARCAATTLSDFIWQHKERINFRWNTHPGQKLGFIRFYSKLAFPARFATLF